MAFEFVFLLLVAAEALAVGNAIRKRFHRSSSRLEAFLVSSGLGFAAISVLMFMLGSLKLLVPQTFMMAHVIFVGLLLVQLRELISISVPDFSWLRKCPAIIRVLGLCFAVFAVLNFLVASAPPSSADSLFYHLTVPKIYLSEHGIVSIPWMQFISEMPMSVDLLYLFGMALSGGNVSQLIATYLSFLAALAVFLLAARRISLPAALVAATLFLTMPVFSVFNVRAYVDIPLTFFALLGIYFFFEWAEQQQLRSAAIAGIFLGMASSAKTIALIVAASVFVVWIVMFLKQPPALRARFVIHGAVIWLVVFAFLAPWLVKSYLNTGDPLQPFLYSYLGGKYWNPELDRIVLHEMTRGIGIGFSPLSLLSFPFQVTVNPSTFGDSAGINPVFLGFAFLFFLRPIPRRVAYLLFVAAIMAALYFFTAQITRYMFTLWALLSVLAAYIVYAARKERRLQAALYVFIVVSVAMNAALWAVANADDLPVVVGIESEGQYLIRKVPTYGATSFLAHTDPSGVVCWYGDARAYWSPNPFVWCDPTLQGYVDFFTMNEPSDLATRLSALNVSYVLLQKSALAPLTTPVQSGRPVLSEQSNAFRSRSNALLIAYLQDHTQKIYEDKATQIYKVVA
ncbi:glycosyltransferase family 39 protein [Candidatus Woesearchaeota archaeon]|nr:glycosyltransferase family 39 protein [Candidatus Woesearchaeota archaeon]